MLLYIIRHGDPDYANDSLTEKGKQQANALAKRLAVNGLDKIYSSPLGRAKATAQPTCDLLGLNYEIEEWTSESLAWTDFSVVYPDGRRDWGFKAQNTLLKNDDTVKLYDEWYNIEVLQGINKNCLERIAGHSDEFLKRHGYERQGSVYRIINPNNDKIAVFCHQGFGLGWLSHLLQIPLHILWASFDISHTGVTIFNFENYENGITNPKCLCLSDLSHIYCDNLPMQYNNSINI